MKAKRERQDGNPHHKSAHRRQTQLFGVKAVKNRSLLDITQAFAEFVLEQKAHDDRRKHKSQRKGKRGHDEKFSNREICQHTSKIEKECEDDSGKQNNFENRRQPKNELGKHRLSLMKSQRE